MAEEEIKILKYSRKKSELKKKIEKQKEIGLWASGNFKVVKIEKKKKRYRKKKTWWVNRGKSKF